MANVKRLGRGLESLRAAARGYRFSSRLAPEAPNGWQSTPVDESFDRQTGIWKWRQYLPAYHRHLNRFRGTDCVLLEIGVLGGGSLWMWRDYLGPDAKVYGADIDPSCGADFIGDQADPAFLALLRDALPRLDVVIDDGGHETHQQIATFESLFPHLASGGVYSVEDMHGPFHGFHWYLDGLARPLNRVAPVAFGSVHRYPFMAVVEKTAVRIEDDRH